MSQKKICVATNNSQKLTLLQAKINICLFPSQQSALELCGIRVSVSMTIITSIMLTLMISQNTGVWSGNRFFLL